MEKITSKTNDASRPATLEDHRPLVDSELDAVTGGATDNTTKRAYRSGAFAFA
jgi:hypothetical protein